jgi:threonylcarbamoyladenosine tRNA methylthiotransferase MtaB
MSSQKIKIHFKNFGCKTNFADLFYILGKIRKYVDFEESDLENSDFVILNSCSVTEDAEKELAKHIRRAKRYGKKVLVSGCLPNLDLKKVMNFGADITIGAGKYTEENLSKVISKILGTEILETQDQNQKTNEENQKTNGEQVENEIEDEEYSLYPDLFPRHRVYLKIQEGCSRFCTFCSIPLTRGLPRFLDKSKVIEYIKRYYDFGIKEVVLVGTHLALYGQTGKKTNSSDMTFGKLVKEIAKAFYRFSDFRIRFSSLSPGEIDDDLLEGLSLGKKIFCPHFHISVQSGSNRILKLMKRWHTFEDFISDSQKLLDIFKDACIGTDIIVGFPGETEEDFRITLENLKNSPVGHIHVFPFSPRPRTPAYFMKRLPESEVKSRVSELIKLARMKREEFIRSCFGKVFYALIEERKEEGYFTGTTENYIQVIFNSTGNYKLGDLIPVKILSLKESEKTNNFAALSIPVN